MHIDVHIEGVGTDRQALADAISETVQRVATGPFVFEVKGRHSECAGAMRLARPFDTLVRAVR